MISGTGTGLLETFAAMARRRGNTSNSAANNTANSNSNSNPVANLFPRGQSSVTSLVRLALSSNFPGIFYKFKGYLLLHSSISHTFQNVLETELMLISKAFLFPFEL